ncbi:putative anti-sigma factor [Pedobacter sp. BAL39]|uniref:FecR family protein n=1 Tax=Pedobacter sp. BAL39 TaxID=391596 RepID=UPI0001559AA0|nr:FecR family protein [Pedobacter sp. BAL39]EDM37762.1 putative anti-sigma factor [Pedobacter sp. BAL39]
MDIQNRTSLLLNLYAENKCSKEELRELFQLINDRPDDADVHRELKEIWIATGSEQSHSEEEWNSMYSTILELSGKEQKKSGHYWQRIAAAAVIFICVSAGLFFYTRKSATNDNSIKPNSLAINKIAPGGNKAILTLSNGTKVSLDGSAEGVIASQGGVQVIKAADGQLIYKIKEQPANQKLAFNTIETPRGGQFQLNMPDGTKVWLNAMSSFTYPVSFKGSVRKVTLKGEAYFEVAKDKHLPFIVTSGSQEVQVLGTHFNINSYTDQEAIQTTLLEGLVKVSSTTNGNTALLKPGQQSQLHADQLKVNAVDVEEVVAWKNGSFTYNKSKLEDIMKQLSRWYDIEVVYRDEEVKHHLFSGTVSRFKDASEVLGVLELTRLVHFKIEGRRIIVMK